MNPERGGKLQRVAARVPEFPAYVVAGLAIAGILSRYWQQIVEFHTYGSWTGEKGEIAHYDPLLLLIIPLLIAATWLGHLILAPRFRRRKPAAVRNPGDG